AAVGADAVVVVHDLVDAVAVAGLDRPRDLGDVGGPSPARGLIDLIADVPGPVGADDEALHGLPSHEKRAECSMRSGPQSIAWTRRHHHGSIGSASIATEISSLHIYDTTRPISSAPGT